MRYGITSWLLDFRECSCNAARKKEILPLQNQWDTDHGGILHLGESTMKHSTTVYHLISNGASPPD